MDFLALYNFSIIFLIVPLSVMAFIAIKSSRDGKSRLIISFLFLISLIYSFAIPLELTSFAKPVSFEWYERNTKEADLLWGHIDINRKKLIMVLRFDGKVRMYSPAWDLQFAQQMQQALRESAEAQKRGGTGNITIKYPFLDSAERQAKMEGEGEGEQSSHGIMEDGTPGSNDDVFHVAPVSAPPPKHEY